jgi:lipopolysaccharide exporter
MTTGDAIVAGGHMVRGSLWSIGLRWSLRLTGVVSTVVLARVLTPEDFGIMAMALLVAGAIEVLSDTGQSLALIRHPNPTREHFDSAWTMSILIGLCIAVVIYAVAPLSVWYFHEPRAITVIQCLALRAFIGGFENVGIVLFRKQLNFARHFQYLVCQKLISFVVSIVLVLLIRDYWALAISVVATRLIGVVLSYGLQPYRPRLSLAKVAELWSFSIWLLVRHIGTWASMRLDEIAVGGVAGAGAMGRYNVAADVSMSPTQEIADPILATLFPVVATIQDNPDEVRALYKRVLYWLCLIAASTSVGVALIANDIVTVVLGPRWSDIAPLMIWLALTSGILGMTDNIFVMLDVVGRPSLSARLQWLRLVILGIVVLPAAHIGSLEFIAICRLGVTGLMAPILFAAVARALPISFGELWSAVWRPLVAAIVMAAAVHGAKGLLADSPAIIRLALEIIVGLLGYAGAILALWRACGAPPGPEQTMIDAMLRVLASRPQPDEPVPVHRQLQHIIHLINPRARLPARVFPGFRPTAGDRAVQLAYGCFQLVSAVPRAGRSVLVSGPHLAALSGAIDLETAGIVLKGLRALARRQAILIVTAPQTPGLQRLCEVLRIDPTDHIESHLNANPHLVFLASRKGRPVALHYSTGRTGMSAVRQHYLGLRLAKPAFARLAMGRLVAAPVDHVADDRSALLAQERLPGRSDAISFLSAAQFEHRMALSLAPLVALHAEAARHPLGADHDLIFVELPRLLDRLPHYADRLGPAIATLQSWPGRRNFPAVLTHGDYWLQNILFDGEPLRITGVIDWEWHRAAGCAGLDAVQLGVISFAFWKNIPLHRLLGEIIGGRCQSAFILDHLAVVKAQFALDDTDIEYLTVLAWLTRIFNMAFNRLAYDKSQLTAMVEQPAEIVAAWIRDRPPLAKHIA